MKKLLFSSLLLLSSINISAGQRELVILLDWKENFKKDGSIGIVTNMLTSALYENSIPILTTQSLWKNVLMHAQFFADFSSKEIDITELKNKYREKLIRVYYIPENVQLILASPEISDQEKEQAKKQIKKPSDKELDNKIAAIRTLSRQILSKTIDPEQIGDEFIEECFIAYLARKELKEWSVEKFSDMFLLCMPQDYFKQKTKQDKKNATCKDYSPTGLISPLSAEELLRGLKKGIPVSNPQNINEIPDPKEKDIDILRQKFTILLPQLFVTKKDVEDNDKAKTELNVICLLHDWYFFEMGHSGIGKRIVDLYPDSFNQFLLFLNDNIKTKFLLYVSCYSGGQRLLTPYERWTQDAVKQAITFNYYIIAGNMLSRVTTAFAPSISLEGDSYVLNAASLQEFFSQIQTYLKGLDVSKLPKGTSQQAKEERQKMVFALHDQLMEALKSILSIEQSVGYYPPAIRAPGTGWFQPLTEKEKVYIITRTLIEAKKKENQGFIIKDKETVVINPFSPFELSQPGIIYGEVPVPIMIEKGIIDHAPLIMSGAFQNAKHYLRELKTPDIGLTELLTSFFAVQDYIKAIEFGGLRYTFYIEKLICINDLDKMSSQILGIKKNQKILTFNNVILLVGASNPLKPEDQTPYNGIIFQYNTNNYAAIWETKLVANEKILKKENKLPNLLKLKQPIPFKYILPKLSSTPRVI